jgi:hypothetical protein
MFASTATTGKEHISSFFAQGCQIEVRYGKAKKMIPALQFTSKRVEILPEPASFKRYGSQRLN